MKPAAAQFGFPRAWDAAWASGLFFLLTLCAAGLVSTPASSRGSHRPDARANRSAVDARAIPAPAFRSEVRNYFMDFAGDHSVDLATVIEQPSAGYANYIVRLHLASGAEQSVALSAPPGGLQIEMHDMTGDKVPNDIILRPALVRWLPTILVNDGHEHFEVAVSGTSPKSFSSSGDMGSRKRDSQTFALLMTAGFKTIHLANSRRPLDPQHRQRFFSSYHRTATERLGYASSSGRAPPLETSI